MKKLLKNLETTMTAIAFAEAGEFETARQIMREDKSRKTGRQSEISQKKLSKRKQLRA